MTKCSDWKTAASICAQTPFTREDFEDMAKAGVSVFEGSWAYDLYPEIDWAKLKEYSGDYGVAPWSFHLPFSGLANPAALDRSVRENTFAFDSELAKRACEVGFKVLVVHPSSEPIAPENRPESILYSKEWLCRLADLAQALKMTVAVEDLPRTCLCNTGVETREIISCDDRLRVCFDVNHLLLDSHKDFIGAVGDRIITLHISDYDFINERHWLPGEGKIDWQELISMLEKINYNGPWLYEISRLTTPTIIRRTIEWSDFRQNHLTLASGKTPEPLGKLISDPVPFWVE